MPVDQMIRKHKKRSGLSIRDLSIACNVGKSAVTSWMNGSNRPTLDNLHKLATAFALGDSERLAFYESAINV